MACPCVLDCPYCHWHVVDVYSHLKFDPCAAAIYARDKGADDGVQ